MSGEENYRIRNARMQDVRPIHQLLSHFAASDLLLGRSLSSLYDHLRDFKVCVSDRDLLVGVAALHICWEDLAEIRSLAVATELHGRGLGGRLVRACQEEAIDCGIGRVFALTYRPAFFRRLGFCDIDKSRLPHKVWSDCLHCSKFPDCNEEALVWEADNKEQSVLPQDGGVWPPS